MSTQSNNRNIPLTLVAESEKKHLRLLELPPELLELLRSKQPPTLELKASGQTTEDAGHVVLCTTNKTFDLRQKNSSNTVYLVQPKSKDDTAEPELEAVAQVYSSLELISQTSSEERAMTSMRASLPIYSSSGIVTRSDLTKQSLFDCTPTSERECADAYRALAAFELPGTLNVFRPSATMAVQIWSTILNTAIAEGVDVTTRLDEASIVAITSQDEAIETAIAQAVLNIFLTRDPNAVTSIDQDRCVAWVGSNLLEAEAADGEVSTKVLLEKWKDLLPEEWRTLAEISKISTISQLGDNGRSISLDRSVLEPGTSRSANGAVLSATGIGTKRKWHEKFRPTKK